MKLNFEILTGRSTKHLVEIEQNIYVHSEVYYDLKAWKDELRREEIDLRFVSAFRDYGYQEKIWNEKVEGKRPLKNKNGIIQDPKNLNEKEILECLLAWSAIPGTSRHHWGTDFDLYDHSYYEKNPDKTLALEIDTYLNGTCRNFYKASLNKKDVFYHPYHQKSQGIQFEPWHFSHKKQVQAFHKNYSFLVFNQNLEASNFKLKEFIQEKSKFFFDHYIGPYLNKVPF